MTYPLSTAVKKHPSALAFDDGMTKLTYADLELAICNSPLMRLENSASGDHLAWCPENRLEDLVAFWAMQTRGYVACPISHRFPDSARKSIVERIDAKWLPDLADAADSDFETSSFSVDSRHQSGLPATIILSSGSSGTPKAIVHSLASHVASAEGAATNMPLSAGDRWLWSLPLCHVSGLSILVRCAVAGATVVGVPDGANLDAEMLNDLRVSHLSVVSTQLKRLLAEEEFPSEHLQAVLLGGSHINPNLVLAARKKGVKVFTTYGSTEMASQVTTSRVDDDPLASGRILPERQLEILPTGEILVRGAVLCLGYYVAGKIEPVVDEEGWFHTRDLGVLKDDGQLTVTGRIDNMFVSGGENIYPENIERAFLTNFDVEQVVVVPQADAEFGVRPVAFVQGELDSNWESVLRTVLQGFEIPVMILPWPKGAMNAIKPDRRYLQSLVDSQA